MPQIYFNKVQRLTQLIGARTTVIVAGRRTGKTDGIAAPFVLRNMQRMPGSTGGIVVPTYKHGLTNTIPGLLAALKRYGYKEGVHFVVGVQPPRHFCNAITEPSEYEHVISWVNGSRAVLLSQDRPGTANSLTLSWVLVDEAKFIDYNKLKDEVLPANGGIKSYFGNKSYNHSMMILSDMPSSKKGSWFLSYKDKMDKDVINAIMALVLYIYNYKKKLSEQLTPITDWQRRHLKEKDRELNQLRSIAVYYKEYSSIENVQLLGDDYIAQMKRDLTPLTFQTSILSQRAGKLRDGFYSSMTDKNIIEPKNSYDLYNTDAPICIGMDYNSNINCLVAGQPTTDGQLIVLNSFYVKYERKIPALISDFCDYFVSHRNKTVVFYYDTTALGSNYAVNTQDFRWVICEELRRHGWFVVETFVGNPMRHDEKYLLINNAFVGKQRLTPVIYREHNSDLIIALQQAGVMRGSKGFKKDKSGEKLPESEEDLLEHRTDITDAFDTLFIGCEKFPQSTPTFNFSTGIY